MMIALFDSNIVIDYLNGIPQAAAELAQYTQAYISPITWVEAQVKARPAWKKLRAKPSMPTLNALS